MLYREYVPTCIETLFSKPATKFKAYAIVPEAKDLALDIGQCECDIRKNYPRRNKTKMAEKCACDDSSSDSVSPNEQCCTICRKSCIETTKKKNRNGRYRVDRRKFIDRPQNIRFKEIEEPYLGKNDCTSYCISHCGPTEHYNFPLERRAMKNKAVQFTQITPEPSCSLCEVEERDSRQFCSVCQVCECPDKPKQRNKYYCRRIYEDRDDKLLCEGHEERTVNKEESCTQVSRIIIESCKICGRKQEGSEESNQRKDDNCHQLRVSPNYSAEICEVGRSIEEITRGDGFFSLTPVAPETSRQRDREMAEGGRQKTDKTDKKLVMNCTCSMCKGKNSSLKTSERTMYSKSKNEGLSSSLKFKKAYSSSEIEILKKEYEDFNQENLKEYKQVIFEELTKPIENSADKAHFRSCNCEYANKTSVSKKTLVDKSEIEILRKKCEDALSQLDQCKKEIAENRETKCKCDCGSTMVIMEDCKGRCTQLERQVTRLQQSLNYYAHLKEREMGESRKGRRLRWDKESPQRRSSGVDDSGEQKKWMPTAAIKVRCTSPKKGRQRPKKELRVSPVRERRITCHHMRCFPPEQLADIPSFRDCPEYQMYATDLPNKRC